RYPPLISSSSLTLCCFFFNDPAPPDIYTLSLHDALPIYCESMYWLADLLTTAPLAEMRDPQLALRLARRATELGPNQGVAWQSRSEEHTSELQSLTNLVCRLLLEKKKINARSFEYMLP